MSITGRAGGLKQRGAGMVDRPTRLKTTLSDYEREVLEVLKKKHGIATLSGGIKSCIRAVGIKLGIGTKIFPNNER